MNTLRKPISIAALLVAAGCARPGQASLGSPPPLAVLAQLEDTAPTQPAEAASILPRHLRTRLALLQPSDEGFERARLPLDAVLTDLAYVPRAVENPPVSAQARLRATRLYVSGRERLLAGRFAEAEADFLQAIALDPAAAEPWRELGEARVPRRDHQAIIEAFSNSIDRGDRHPRSLLVLAGELMQAGRSDDALAQLALAASQNLRGHDPAIAPLIMTNLGSLLFERGYALAAAEALQSALAPLDATVLRSQYGRELNEVMQRSPALWLQAGDAFCRIGEFDRAVEAYEQAEATPRPGAESATERSVYALLMSGKAAEAAMVIADASARPERSLDERLVLLAHRFSHLKPAVAPSLHAELKARFDNAPQAAGPTFRGWAARLLAASLSPDVARERLAEALVAHPWNGELALAYVRAVAPTPGDDAITAASELAARYPELIHVLAPAIAMRSCGDAITPQPGAASATSEVLAAAVALEQGHPQRALARLEGLTRRGRDTALMHVADAVRIRALAALGQFEQAEAALADLQRTAPAPRVLFSAFVGLQRFSAAADLARAHAERGDDAARAGWLRALAEVELARGRGNERVEVLLRLVKLDPFDAASQVEILQASQPQGPAADAARLAEVGAWMRANLSNSTEVRRIVAVELTQRGLDLQAEELALALADERPFDDNSMQLLGQTFAVADQRRPGAAEQGVRWLDDHLAEHPLHEAALVARARLLLRLRRAEEAQASLAVAGLPPGRMQAARAREEILADVLDRDDEARSVRLARLQAAPPSIETIIEHAATHAAALKPDEALSLLRSIPRQSELTLQQKSSVATLSVAAAPAAARDKTGPGAHTWLELVEWALDRDVVLGPSAHGLRLVLLALHEPPDLPALSEAVKVAEVQAPDDIAGMRYAPVRALLDIDRRTDAVRVLAVLAQSDPAPEPGIHVAWMRLVTQAGDDDDVRTLAAAFPDGEPALRVLDEFGDGGLTGSRTIVPKAELLYRLAALLNGAGRDDLADEMYRRVLELDPTNPWACNDYGYRLAERGERLAEAEVLLEHAYAQLPDRHSVIDSLGWLRYRRGELLDVVDEAGALVREGAVTLLTRAVDLAGEEASAEALEHLGDALWQVGRNDEARSAWNRALDAAREDAQAAAAPGVPDVLKQRVETRLRSVQARIDALAQGKPPPVAKVIAGG